MFNLFDHSIKGVFACCSLFLCSSISSISCDCNAIEAVARHEWDVRSTFGIGTDNTLIVGDAAQMEPIISEMKHRDMYDFAYNRNNNPNERTRARQELAAEKMKEILTGDSKLSKATRKKLCDKLLEGVLESDWFKAHIIDHWFADNPSLINSQMVNKEQETICNLHSLGGLEGQKNVLKSILTRLLKYMLSNYNNHDNVHFTRAGYDQAHELGKMQLTVKLPLDRDVGKGIFSSSMFQLYDDVKKGIAIKHYSRGIHEYRNDNGIDCVYRGPIKIENFKFSQLSENFYLTCHFNFDVKGNLIEPNHAVPAVQDVEEDQGGIQGSLYLQKHS